MSYRFMRIIVFFDLPTVTGKNRKDYRRFRKFLIKSGFLMMQESVYCKLVTSEAVGDGLVSLVRNNRPPEGIVQLLKVTEKQYGKMEFITGAKKRDVLDSDDRLIII